MGTEQMQLVTLNDKSPVTNSRIIGEVFGKDHDDVLRTIRNLIKDVGDSQEEEERLRKIAESSEHLRKIAEMFHDEVERRREFGEGAGKLIGEPIRTYEPVTRRTRTSSDRFT